MNKLEQLERKNEYLIEVLGDLLRRIDISGIDISSIDKELAMAKFAYHKSKKEQKLGFNND